MTASIFQVTYRAPGGAAGSPSSLLTGQIAYNAADGYFYVGYGDNGSGVATSIKAFAQHDFNVNKLVPAGGSTGQLLAKTSASDYSYAWINPPLNYAGGTGISISGSTVAVDTSVIATVTSLNNGLATKANAVHTHDAGDVVSGQFDPARIPSLDASKVTSGVFDVARIPVLPSTAVQVSSGDLTALTTTQQNAIVQGTIVTTQDGNRWVYAAGSKTAQASYVQLADVTPEWSVIANKPVFATVATSGSYADLSNKPTISTAGASGSYTDLINKPALSTVALSGSYNDLSAKPSLGTMASQNASAIAVTGGTMSGVTMTNCVFNGGTF